ncbi:MAG: hypothetical protein AB1631_11505 [Acidobacteriota bacterium]
MAAAVAERSTKVWNICLEKRLVIGDSQVVAVCYHTNSQLHLAVSVGLTAFAGGENMKTLAIRKSWKLLLNVAVLVGLVALIAIRMNSTTQSQSYAPNLAAVLQSGIGAEAPCPTSSSNLALRINNAKEFIQYRSGVVLTQETIDRLSSLEQATLPGWCNMPSCPRLTRQQVKDVITATFMNALGSLSDAQIDNMAYNSLRVLPGYARAGRVFEVQLRSSQWNMGPEEFKQMAKDIRSPYSLYRPLAQTEIANLVDQHLDWLAYGCSDWNMSTYSPYQVFMLAYSLASDDLMGRSRTELAALMEEDRIRIYNDCGLVCPTEGRCAFGDTGYLYSSPMTIFFNDAAQNDLLNRIDALY